LNIGEIIKEVEFEPIPDEFEVPVEAPVEVPEKEPVDV
jgi:hypothetical protein